MASTDQGGIGYSYPQTTYVPPTTMYSPRTYVRQTASGLKGGPTANKKGWRSQTRRYARVGLTPFAYRVLQGGLQLGQQGMQNINAAIGAGTGERAALGYSLLNTALRPILNPARLIASDPFSAGMTRVLGGLGLRVAPLSMLGGLGGEGDLLREQNRRAMAQQAWAARYAGQAGMSTPPWYEFR